MQDYIGYPTVCFYCMLHCMKGSVFFCYVCVFTEVEDSYSGPKLDDDISAGFMKNMLQWFKDQKKLHKKYCYKVRTLCNT